MALILDRAEFFTLAVFFRAAAIVGLDPAALVAADRETQLALYMRGRDQLQERDLIRPDGQGVFAPEQALHRSFGTVVAPDQILMILRALPTGERDLLLFYGRDGDFVELTIPRAGIFRLASIGAIDVLVTRLLEILPIADRPFVPEGLVLSNAVVVQAFQLMMAGRMREAETLLTDSSSPDGTLARYLVDVFAAATFAGNITFVRSGQDGTTVSSDITVIHSPDEVWSLLSHNGSDQMLAERTNATVLRATLTQALSPATV